jgi:formyltetrahydrofolate synthetase
MNSVRTGNVVVCIDKTQKSLSDNELKKDKFNIVIRQKRASE